MELVGSDPFISIPGHWVRSTLQRRLAGRFSDQAAIQRQRLEEDPGNLELRQHYISSALTAFRIVYTDFSEKHYGEIDYLYQLEFRRRLNDIVYYAGMIVEVSGGWAELNELGFTESRMRELLSTLHKNGIDALGELYLVHTVGFCYNVLGEMAEAARAGKAVLRLVVDAGEDPSNKVVASLLADAFSWLRRGELAHAVTAAGAESDRPEV
jgi:hypothetical protein